MNNWENVQIPKSLQSRDMCGTGSCRMVDGSVYWMVNGGIYFRLILIFRSDDFPPSYKHPVPQTLINE